MNLWRRPQSLPNFRTRWRWVALLGLLLALPPPMNVSAKEPDPRGVRFFAFDSFRKFKKEPGEEPGESILLSPEISARMPWDELIVSWNADAPPGTYLQIEARALMTNRVTKYYNLGRWSADPGRHPRESVLNQKDEDGDVKTDTLVLRQPAGRFQLRLTLGGDGKVKPRVKFVGVSLRDSSVTPTPLPANRAAWGATRHFFPSAMRRFSNT